MMIGACPMSPFWENVALQPAMSRQDLVLAADGFTQHILLDMNRGLRLTGPCWA